MSHQCNGWPVGTLCDRPAIGGDEDGNLGCIKHAPLFNSYTEASMYLDAWPWEVPERWIETGDCSDVCRMDCDCCPCANEHSIDPIVELLWAMFGWLWELDHDALVYWPEKGGGS